MTRPIIDPSHGTRPQARVSPLVAAVAAATSIIAVVAVSACGGGTDSGPQVASVPGVNATSRDGVIKMLNLIIPYPATGSGPSADPRQCPPPQPDPAVGPTGQPGSPGPGSYPSGCDIPLNIRIFNDGTRAARLTGVKVEGTSAGTATVVMLTMPTPTSPPSSSPAPQPSASASASGGSPSTRASGAAGRRSSGAPVPARAPSGSAGSPSPSEPPATTAPPASPSAAASTAIAIDLPAGQLVMLTPGSIRYLVIRNLPNDLKIGGSVRLTFNFAYAGQSGGTTVEHIAIPVAPPVTGLRPDTVAPSSAG